MVRTTSRSSVLLDSGTLAVECVVGGALETFLASTVQLAAAELAQDWRAQLRGCEAAGQHCGGVVCGCTVFLKLAEAVRSSSQVGSSAHGQTTFLGITIA